MKPIVVPEHVVEKGLYVRSLTKVTAFVAPVVAAIFGVVCMVTVGLSPQKPPAGLPMPPSVVPILLGLISALGAFILCTVVLRLDIASKRPALTVGVLAPDQRLSIEENEIVRTSPVGGIERLPLTEETLGAVARDVLFLWSSAGHGVRLALPLSAFASPADRATALRHLYERKVLRWGWRP